MKFLSILPVFLVFVIAIANTASAAKVGDKVQPLGVRFKDLYASQIANVTSTYNHFNSQSKAFDTKIAAAAKQDGTDAAVTKALLEWNEKYRSEVAKLHTSTKKLSKSIKKLGVLLKK
ncbi:18832_t:CDS:1 [Dentiscutata erythropus]|uniref:18832_t:CDS:1 n=1 Tax=Dentiscutata erythropus TaxID=1348616 RepID=A0A9N9I599_9GLOM|nr:18832_t:CDS:1 [Dentiscutata erythropus]